MIVFTIIFWSDNIYMRKNHMLIPLSELQSKRRPATTLASTIHHYIYIVRHLCRTKIHLDRHIFLSDHFSKAMHPKLRDLESLKQNSMQRGLKINIYIYYAHLYIAHWIPCHHTLSLDRSRYSLCRLCIPIHPHEHKNSSCYRYSSDLHNRVVGRQIQAKILIIIASLCTLPNNLSFRDIIRIGYIPC